ncbi:MAG: hypothetical protein FJ363_08860 [Gemmatimonadetes bacterium]|nr:hypothetical protein [Gemmatimonadota bacterium]
MLRPLRRHRLLLGPLYAGAMLAFLLRLGWSHDRDCPHHATAHATTHAPAAHGAASAAQVVPAEHAGHAGHAGHADTKPGSSERPTEGDCQCLDRSCATGGLIVALSAAAASEDATADTVADETARARRADPERAGVYSSHLLPYPHAPPGIDVLT